jgi:hypothetical protein
LEIHRSTKASNRLITKAKDNDMDADTLKFIFNFTATKAVGWAAGALLTVGFLQPNQETQFETIGASIVVAALGYAWSWWNTRGKAAVLAELAKAHGVAPPGASIAAASNAIQAKISTASVVPTAAGAAKIVGALLLAVLVLHTAPAMAQTKKTAARAVETSTSGVPCDPLSLIPGCTPTTVSTALTTNSANLQMIWNEIVSATQADLNYAEALAVNVNSPGSKLRATCYAALITANQQANGMTLKNADGTPMVAPNPAVISKFEQAAELVDNLQATAPVMSACAAAANAVAQSTTQFLTTILSAVAVKAAVPLP